jgi:predicted esterase
MTLPMFVAQGTKDELVRPPTTDAYVARLCAAKADVVYDHVEDTGHGLVALRALPRVQAFFRDTLAGRAVASTC